MQHLSVIWSRWWQIESCYSHLWRAGVCQLCWKMGFSPGTTWPKTNTRQGALCQFTACLSSNILSFPSTDISPTSSFVFYYLYLTSLSCKDTPPFAHYSKGDGVASESREGSTSVALWAKGETTIVPARCLPQLCTNKSRDKPQHISMWRLWGMVHGCPQSKKPSVFQLKKAKGRTNHSRWRFYCFQSIGGDKRASKRKMTSEE